MLLLSLLSAAAIALDARGMRYVPGSQMASAPLAAETGTGQASTAPTNTQAPQDPEEKAFTCMPGVNYELLQDKNKGDLTISCTLEYRCSGTSDAAALSNCNSKTVKATAPQYPKGHVSCSSTAVSQIKYCIPEILQDPSKKNESCINLSCKTGERIVPTKLGGVQKKLGEAVDAAFKSDDPLRKEAALQYVPKLDTGLGKSLLDNWGSQYGDELYDKKAEISAYDKSIADLQKSLEDCDPSTCSTVRAQINASTAERSALVNQVATLEQYATSLQAPVNPGSVGGSCLDDPACSAGALGGQVPENKTPTLYNCPGGPNCSGGTFPQNQPPPNQDPPRRDGVNTGGISSGNNSGSLLSSLFGGQQDNYCVISNYPRIIQPGPARQGCLNYRPSPLQQIGSLLGLGQQGAQGANGQQCSAMGSLFGTCTQAPQPACTIAANTPQISAPTSGQQPQPVTLTWQTQNAHAANLSAIGSVGPQGSVQVYPQQTTTYTLQVVNNGASATGGYYQTAATPVYAQCATTVTVGGGAAGVPASATSPVAQISCQPQIVDPGMQVAISYACQNATLSSGTNFSTNGALSGSAIETISPSMTSSQVFSLRCTNESATHVAQCSVQINKTSIAFVANPSVVQKGKGTSLGWVTSGMSSCVVSSASLPVFTADNENNTSPAGVAQTGPLTSNTVFDLTCTSKSGAVKKVSTTVEVN